MIRWAANLTMWWKELPFPERFERAVAAGFDAVEFMSPFRYDLRQVVEAAKKTGLRVVQYNFADGDIAGGDRGFLSHPNKKEEWREGLLQALELAKELNPRQLNSLAGNELEGTSREAQIACLEENLRWALPHLEKAGVPLVLESLNRRDNPRYLLGHTVDVLKILGHINSPWVRCQFDVYHAQRTHGNLVETIRQNIQWTSC